VARDRKRAKQRQQRRGAAPGGRSGGARGGHLTRADLPGSLEHVGDVDEFDAALVRGAEGAPAQPAPEPDSSSAPALTEPAAAPERDSGGNGVAARPVAVPGRPARGERQSLPVRALAFLRASWAELQRVQWPDRRQVAQATGVVIGFVIIAGLYLGVADWVAKQIVNAII
jgi:preprotein translocase SecE subunit